MKDKVVVVGGSGFLGSHLSEALSDKGYAVTILDLVRSPWLRDGQQMIIGDIMDADCVARAIQGARYVYQLAGVAEIGKTASIPMETIESNIIGSVKVIEACRAEQVERFVYASTVYVYSRQGSFYRVTKQAVELLLESYREAFGFEHTILRYGSLYGPRAQEWNGLKRYITEAVRDGSIRYPGTGDERREYIHVRDAANLSVQALAPEYANQCLTITGTQVLTSRELMRMIQEIMGGEIQIQFRPESKDADHYSITPYRFTPREARKIVPKEFRDLGQGILDLVEEVYHANGAAAR
ncbi:MAG: NAD(P)-dependent oxidoreductase [Candidatus Eisenbacteria sp.]|nr:NAD(P)-dependent oxidoreductase [Candidatus Eisenbacteria bacterium]